MAKELGHDGDALVKRVYGHLGQQRHRAAVVEYRVEQHGKVLAERLERLRVALPVARPLAPRWPRGRGISRAGAALREGCRLQGRS